MLGMKRDCGGAAGILGAFRAAVKQVSLKSVTLSKPPFLLCNSSFQVKCLLVAMWRWEHNAFVGWNSMTVVVFYVKSTRGWLYMHSPKNKNKIRKTIVLTYYYTGTSNVDVFSRPPPPRIPPPLKKKTSFLDRRLWKMAPTWSNMMTKLQYSVSIDSCQHVWERYILKFCVMCFHSFSPVLSRQGFSENLHALFCMAENAVGSRSTRPDDILTLYSGK